MTIVSRAAAAAPLDFKTADASHAKKADSGPSPFKRSSGLVDTGRATRRDKMDSPGGFYRTGRPEDHEIQNRGMQLQQLFQTASGGDEQQHMMIKPDITVHGNANEFHIIDKDLTIRVTPAGVAIVRAPSADFAHISKELHAVINLDRVGRHLQRHGFTSNVQFDPNVSPNSSSASGSGNNSPVLLA